MAGSGPTAHCTVRAGPGCGAMGREEDKGQKADQEQNATLSWFHICSICVCPSRRYAARGANNRHRQASEIPVLGLAGGSKPSMSMALMYFLPES